jgi:hypothetical protein
LAEIQGIVNLIAAKSYAGGAAGGKDVDEATTNHDELFQQSEDQSRI